MTKGLFTNSEEIRFQHVYVQGNIDPVKGPKMDLSQVRQNGRCLAQNMKKQNQCAIQNRMRMRTR
jgi:hypothetical protein